MSMMSGTVASELIPCGTFMGSVQARAAASTTTITLTVPAAVLDNDCLVAYAFGNSESDSIAASTGTWLTYLTDATTLNCNNMFVRTASSEPTPGSGTWTFTKTGTAGAWFVVVMVMRGVRFDGTTQQGVWSSGTTYATDDLVTYSGNVYLAKQASTGVTPDHAGTGPTNWRPTGSYGRNSGLPPVTPSVTPKSIASSAVFFHAQETTGRTFSGETILTLGPQNLTRQVDDAAATPARAAWTATTILYTTTGGLITFACADSSAGAQEAAAVILLSPV